MSDLAILALVVGLIATGTFLVHSMTVTRSVVRVRLAAVVSIVLMMLLMVVLTTR